MNELFDFVLEVFGNLFDSPALMETLGRPEYVIASLVLLNLIVFVETGIFFFLPGDSLLVTAGLVCYSSPGWGYPLLPVLLVTLSVSAIVGDSVGYAIGYKAGPKIFNREKSFFFNKDHLLKAQAFYEKHGGKTIVLARFMPIIRTFAPVVAGVGRMKYRRFLFFNVFGGVGWVFSMILTGFYLPPVLNPVFQPLFGEGFRIEHHVEKVVIIVVLLSISPALFVWLRNKFRKAPKQELEPVEAGK